MTHLCQLGLTNLDHMRVSKRFQSVCNCKSNFNKELVYLGLIHHQNQVSAKDLNHNDHPLQNHQPDLCCHHHQRHTYAHHPLRHSHCLPRNCFHLVSHQDSDGPSLWRNQLPHVVRFFLLSTGMLYDDLTLPLIVTWYLQLYCRPINTTKSYPCLLTRG